MLKYYHWENKARYDEMTRMGLPAWAEQVYGGDAFTGFTSRGFLEDVLPRLGFDRPEPTALEIGTGVGPGALFLAERGFRVTGYDLIPEAIETARSIARQRGLAIAYEVTDATQIPLQGERFDLVVDSYCLQNIVFDQERDALFESVRARLAEAGYYLVSTAIYDREAHHPAEKIVDQKTGIVYDCYRDGIYDPTTDIYYERLGPSADREETVRLYEGGLDVGGMAYMAKRRYRDGTRLRAELEAQGFDVVYQAGEFDENVVCVHAGSGVELSDHTIVG